MFEFVQMQKKLLHILILVLGQLCYAQQCPSITDPLDDATDVTTDTSISWKAVDNAEGYFLLVGTTPGGRDIIDRVDVGNKTTYVPPDGLPGNTVIYVKVTVYFADGFDNTCPWDRFTTGDPTPGNCNHFISRVPDFHACDDDGDSFEEFDIDLVDLESKLIGIQTDLTLTFYNAGGDLIDFSDPGEHVAVNQRTIRVRATDDTGCFKETSFDLILITPPTAEKKNDIVECESYMLPSLAAGSHYFTGTDGGGSQLNEGDTVTDSQTIYIYTGESGCSSESSFKITIDSSLCTPPVVINADFFPAFFTPNGDGINDFWNYTPPEEVDGAELIMVEIFDRFGMLLAQVAPDSQGWNGTLAGKKLPSSDYWFRAITVNNEEVKGHFTLKR